VGEQQTAQPTPSHDIATYQKANKPAFLVSCTPFALALFLSLFLAARIAEQVGEK
jgi:hypothetical protein